MPKFRKIEYLVHFGETGDEPDTLIFYFQHNTFSQFSGGDGKNVTVSASVAGGGTHSYTKPQSSITLTPSSSGSLLHVVSTTGNGVYDGAGDVIITLVVTSGNAALDKFFFTVTILDPPEFYMEGDTGNTKIVNADYYSIGNYGKPKKDELVTDSLRSHAAYAVKYAIVNNGSGGAFTIDENTGVIKFKIDAAPTSARTFETTIQITVTYADPKLYQFSDVMELNVSRYWAEFVTCVDQPIAGEGGNYALTHSYLGYDLMVYTTAGHAFYIVEMPTQLVSLGLVSSGLGGYANTPWGYYPTNEHMVTFTSVTLTCPGKLKNDTAYLASPGTDVYQIDTIQTLGKLISVLLFTYNKEATPGTYDLETKNCVGITIDAATAAGVTLPTIKHKYHISYGLVSFDFDGYDPADFGEDLIAAGKGAVYGKYTR